MIETVALSAFSTWKERTEPPRSTSEMIARLSAGRLAALGEGAALPLLGTLRLCSLPEVGFVGLHDAAHGRKHAIAHGFADAVRHEPGGLESDAEGAVKLVARNALLAGGEERDGVKPDVERNVARSNTVPTLTVNFWRHW